MRDEAYVEVGRRMIYVGKRVMKTEIEDDGSISCKTTHRRGCCL